MNDEPASTPGARLKPALVWAWSCGPQDDEVCTVEARVAQLVACGWEAVLLDTEPPETDTLRIVRTTAAKKGLRVMDVPPARAVRLESPLTDRQIEDLANALVEQADLDAIVCIGPEQDAAALLAGARRLRRWLDRLAWERFH